MYCYYIPYGNYSTHTVTYRFSQLQDRRLVCDWTTVTSLSNKSTRQKHGTQVISVQDIDSQRGGGCSTVTDVRGSVLKGQRKIKPIIPLCLQNILVKGECFIGFVFLVKIKREHQTRWQPVLGSIVEKITGFNFAPRLFQLFTETMALLRTK